MKVIRHIVTSSKVQYYSRTQTAQKVHGKVTCYAICNLKHLDRCHPYQPKQKMFDVQFVDVDLVQSSCCCFKIYSYFNKAANHSKTYYYIKSHGSTGLLCASSFTATSYTCWH
jgi:glycine cleavage system protein P-like pyridoxal-binding family